MEPMQRKSILLVDDEQLVLDSLTRELTAENSIGILEVTPATNGEDAIEILTNNLFDLIITDLLMPRIDGFQVLKAAKKHHSETMVIILTGYADLDSAIDALRLGADDFLQKPCDTGELLYRMRSCFDKQNLRKKVRMYEKILPICCYCKKIRADSPGDEGKGLWYSLEDYFTRTKGVDCSHGCCPECFAKLMPEILG